MSDINVSGVRLDATQVQWLENEYGPEEKYWFLSLRERADMADLILAAVHGALEEGVS